MVVGSSAPACVPPASPDTGHTLSGRCHLLRNCSMCPCAAGACTLGAGGLRSRRRLRTRFGPGPASALCLLRRHDLRHTFPSTTIQRSVDHLHSEVCCVSLPVGHLPSPAATLLSLFLTSWGHLMLRPSRQAHHAGAHPLGVIHRRLARNPLDGRRPGLGPRGRGSSRHRGHRCWPCGHAVGGGLHAPMQTLAR